MFSTDKCYILKIAKNKYLYIILNIAGIKPEISATVIYPCNKPFKHSLKF